MTDKISIWLAAALVTFAVVFFMYNPTKAHGQVQTCVWPHTCIDTFGIVPGHCPKGALCVN